jgi:hypothetical protein
MAKTMLGNMIKKAQAVMSKSNTNSKLLGNKYLLYLVLFLAIADLLIFATSGDILFIVVFILVGIVTAAFSKNMIIILIVAMVVTNIIKFGSAIKTTEGMTSKDKIIKEQFDAFDDDVKTFLKEVADGKQEGLTGLTKEEKEIFEQMTKAAVKESLENKDEKDEDEESEDSEDADKPKSEGMTNKTKTKESLTPMALNKSKLQEIKGLEQETKQLAKTQKKLLENMKTLEPMLSQAETFMKQFEENDKKFAPSNQ